jgi:uncharacterized protein (PEP-CTERM system associated)
MHRSRSRATRCAARAGGPRPQTFLAWRLAPLAAATLAALPAHAGEWVESLRVDTRATLTDNVRLAPKGQEKTDLVLQATPELSLLHYGGSSFARIDYRPTLYVYARTPEDNTLRNYLNSLLSIEAVENFFFVDFRARVEDSFISPFRPGTWDSVANVENRVQTASFAVSPWVRGEFGGGYRYLVRNDNYWTTVDATALNGQLDNRVRARLDSPAGPHFGWAADYNFRRTQFESTDPFYEQQVRFIPRYRLTPELEVSGRVGYETNDYGVGSYSGSIYGGGLDWRPNPRTALYGFVEHRFFGTGYQADALYRTRITSWRLHGSRDTSTYRDQLFSIPAGDTRELLDAAFSSRIPDPIEREQAVEEFLQSSGLPATSNGPLTFYTNRVQIWDRIDASTGIFGARNALTFNVFYRKSRSVLQTTQNGSPDPVPDVLAAAGQIEQRGGVLAFSHNLSERSAITASYRRTLSEATDPAPGRPLIRSTEDLYRITFNQRLTPNTLGAIGIRYVDFSSDRTNSSYKERAVFVAVSHRFF